CVCCFFFSSRRRHTRSYGDWSSTCALPIYLRLSDLVDRLADRLPPVERSAAHEEEAEQDRARRTDPEVDDRLRHREVERSEVDRSEERRVGKEGRYRWAADE